MTLQRVQGPDCPECGCQDAEVVDRGTRWGQPHERRQCNHCGRTWYAAVEQSAVSDQPSAEAESNDEADQLVVYRSVCCPHCGSAQTKVTSTRRPIRHHKCLECGWSFKSMEG